MKGGALWKLMVPWIQFQRGDPFNIIRFHGNWKGGLFKIDGVCIKLTRGTLSKLMEFDYNSKRGDPFKTNKFKGDWKGGPSKINGIILKLPGGPFQNN